MNGAAWLLLGLLAGASWGWWALRRLRRALQILQLEEYDNRRALRWARGNWSTDYAPVSFLVAFVLMLTLTVVALEGWGFGTAVVVLLFVALGLGTPATAPVARPKKPLVLTARVKRLLVALTLVVIALGAVLLLGGWTLGLPGQGAFLVGPLVAWLLIAGAPQLCAAANLLALPVEAANRRRYRVDAAARLRTVAPKIVAITGSYGKTTTKELIAAVLEARYRVLKTPASFNTVMGITRVIREQLRDDHEVFVVEMGAYHRGDIRGLCRFVGGPDISCLVGINEQHLERMGSIQHTISAKYEIVEETKPGGVTVLNVDNPYCDQLAARTEHVRVVRVGSVERNPCPDLYADNVTVNPKVMRFDVHDGDQTLTVRTRLIGRHLLPNLLIALAVGRELGVDLRTGVSRLGRVEPVGHRLAVSESDGLIVIDDAYSANVDGARAAIALLAELPAQRRFMVTPGIVELGQVEAARNRELGAQAAAVCDTLLVVGGLPGRYVLEGARAAGMAKEQAIAVETLAAAQEYLRGHTARGDAVLFENDLPDNYA